MARVVLGGRGFNEGMSFIAGLKDVRRDPSACERLA
jgi:hypothetical protein